MADSNLLQVIKRIVKETTDAQKPCDYLVGTVISETPLKIKVSNSITVDSDFLDLSRNVTDFETSISIYDEFDWTIENAGRIHNITVAEKKVKVRNGLKAGEKVLMIQKAKGKRYAVIDRVVGA